MGRRVPEHVWIDEIWLDVSVREAHGLSADVTEHPVESGADVADHIRPKQRTVTIEGVISNTPIDVPQSHMDGATEDASPLSIAGEPSHSGPPQTYEIEGEPSFGNVDTGLGEVNIPGSGQASALAGVVGITLGSKRQFTATGAPHSEVGANAEFAAQALHFTQEFDRVGAVHLDLESIILSAKRITIVTTLTIYENVALTDLHVDRDFKTGNALRFTATGRELRIVASDTVDLPNPVDSRAVKPRARGKQLTTEAAEGESQRVRSAAAALAGLG